MRTIVPKENAATLRQSVSRVGFNQAPFETRCIAYPGLALKHPAAVSTAKTGDGKRAAICNIDLD